MCKKLIYLTSFVLVLGLALPSVVEAADPDLVGWWKLDDASGTIAIDSSGNGYDGTLLGDPEWVAGQLGGALYFDGDGDTVHIGNADVFNFPGSFSISVWVNYEAWNGGWSNVMVGKEGEGGRSWQLRRHGENDNLTFTIRGTSGDDDPQGTIVLTFGEWHHIVAIYDADAGTRAVYIDNVLDVQIDDSGVHTPDDNSLYIGARSNNNDDGPTGFLLGSLDDVYIFSRALTVDEIPGLSKGLSPGSASEPIPDDEDIDVLRDAVLSWEPGEFAATHDVYLGTVFDDVNDADRSNPLGVLASEGQSATTYDPPGRLDFGQTYYWRVDEVNAISGLDENFDCLDVGANVHNVEGWEGWYGDEGAGGYVTDDQAYSGNHSLEFAIPVDLVPHWERKTSGSWILTTMQYVPSTATTGEAYYGVLSGYLEADLNWIASVVSDLENNVVRLDGLDPEPELPLVRDAWAEIRVEVDLDAQVSNFYYNGELLGTHGADVTRGLEGIDLWAVSDDVIYFDDFLLEPAPEIVLFKGDVWSFTTELFAYPIENITVTASSSAQDQGPENTVNGSGLDNDLHSTELTEMWLSGMGAPGPAWIQYEFDKVYKLHEMLVWNHNGTMELILGLGCKEVTIEYSVNGTDYTTLGAAHEFARGTGAADYAPNTTVDLEGVAAKYVRLTPNSNWGGLLVQYGLSEVRFFSIPVQATKPSPDSGATDVAIDVTLGWRPGREAAEHDVYLSTDEQAVIDGTAPVNTVTENSYGTSLDLGSTYYWRVDEVNDAEIPTTWQSEIWNLTTPEYFFVDDFESYNETPAGEEGSNLVYLTWIDGYDNPSVNGSFIGHFRGDTLEYSIVCNGKQSAPLYYNNYTAGNSEITANVDDLQIGQDWTKGGAETLVLWIRGALSNDAATDQLYVKINDAKVVYDSDLSVPLWKQLNVDLASLGIDLSNITTLSIGVEGSGSGMLHVDDITLYRIAPPVVEPAPGSDMSLVGHWKLDETSGLIAADSSGYGNDGTLIGMDGTEWTAGIRDGALGFDGNGIVDCGNPKSLQLSGEATISAWVKLEPANEDVYMGIGGKLKSGPYNGFALVRHSSNVFRIWMGNNGGDLSSASSDVTYNDTDWHHVVGVMSNNTGSLYVDGVKQAEEAACGIVDAGDYAYIGKQYSNGSDRYWVGTIDDVRIYYRGLSEQEILGL